MPQTSVFPDIGQFPGSANIHIENGKLMPAFDHAAMTNSADVLHYFIKEVVETQNPSGNPRQYAFANNQAFFFEDGARTTDQSFTAGNAVQCAGIVEGPPFTNGIGTKKLMVSFGTGAAETTRLRTLTTDTSPWTAAVGPGTATQATMFKFVVLGDGSVIAATGSAQSSTNIGRCSLGEYFIGKCKRGDDPTLAASYGNVQACGSPEWPIIDIAPLRDSFCVAKGDGLYYWDDRVKRFKNALDRVKFLPHALNGKGCTAGENGVWYPMADGRLFFFDGVTVKEETPWKQWVLPRDVMVSRVSAITDRGDIVAARTEAFYNTVEGARAASALGMRVFTVTGVAGGTVTEITANVTDGSLATGASLSGIGTRTTDKLVIGMTQPAEGFVVRVTRTANTAVNSFVTPECSNGAGAWTSLGTIRDGTVLGTAGISLALTGYPPGASNAYIGWTAINSYDLSATDTFNAVTGLYWYRFSFTNTTAFIGGTIDEIEPIPARGGLTNTGMLTTSNNFTHRSKAGCTGRVFIGRRTGGKIVWNDEYEIDDGGGVWAMGWTTARSGTNGNGGPPLVLWGRYQQTVIAESVTRDPSRTPYPKLLQVGTSKPAPRLAIRKLQLGDPTKRTKINLISVQGQFIQPTDKFGLYAWWDNQDKPFEFDTDFGSPSQFSPPPIFPSTGREFNCDLIFSDVSQSDPAAPYITHIIIDYDDVGDAYAFERDSATATPEPI